mmetsp:Transcript_3699/g.5730  ORF Transcript_3699/g.5730 Transcript_3699/m.5730 type:complete len:486 (-) Transcript_3699:274-1731(-)
MAASIIPTKCCHLPVICSSGSMPVVVYFDGVWCRREPLSHRSSLLRMLPPHMPIYHICSEYCDEAEEFIVSLGASSLPALAVFCNGQLVNVLSEKETPLEDSLRLISMQDLICNSSSNKTSLTNLIRARNAPLLLFISGDRSSVGKSTFCLYLLAALLRQGLNPDDVAYIKPITQCEAEQPVVKFCNFMGVRCRGIGPVVFYKGFTRAYLEGTTDTSQEMLQQVRESVEEIGRGRRVVLVDGVGYPAVGSICGISNADAAKILDAPVLLVGKSGVGDAVDSFNLNARFFEHAGVKVLGAVFNKLPLEGFYSLEACKKSVTSYFDQYRGETRAYGFIPLMAHIEEANKSSYLSAADIVPESSLETFMRSVDISTLLMDLCRYQADCDAIKLSQLSLRCRTTPYDISGEHGRGGTGITAHSSSMELDDTRTIDPVSVSPRRKRDYDQLLHRGSYLPSNTQSHSRTHTTKRSREEIEAEAKRKGAKAG